MTDREVVGTFGSGSLFFVYTEGDGPCVFVGVYRSIEQAVEALTRAGREQSGVQMLQVWRNRAGLKEPWQAAIFEVAWGKVALHSMVHHWSSKHGLRLA